MGSFQTVLLTMQNSLPLGEDVIWRDDNNLLVCINTLNKSRQHRGSHNKLKLDTKTTISSMLIRRH